MQRRGRIYFLCVRLDLLQAADLDGAAFTAACMETFQVLKLPLQPLGSFLMPLENVKQWLAKLRSVRAQRSRQSNGKHIKWEEQHLDIYLQNGCPLPHRQDMEMSLRQLLGDDDGLFTDREQSILYYMVAKGGLGSEQCDIQALDLSQSLGRVPLTRAGIIPCICPHSLVFAILPRDPNCREGPGGHRGRPLIPLEHLLLQGIDLRASRSPDRAHHWSWKDLADLAGNAFSGHCIAAALLTLITNTTLCR